MQSASASPTSSYLRRSAVEKPSVSSNASSTVRIQSNKVGSSKPVQDSGGGYDSKLIEMINSVIVDRSPSVKWEDIGENLPIVFHLFQYLCLIIYKSKYLQLA